MGSLRWRSARACAVLSLLAFGRSASAQPPPREDRAGVTEERRTALYREGVDAAIAGRWAEAKDRFAEALAIRSSAKVLFSLAQAEERLGQFASASSDYERARDTAKAAAEADVVTAAEQARVALAPRVPHVRVTVSGAATATATLDGQPIAVDAVVAVDPGSHEVVVTAPGAPASVIRVAVAEGQQRDVPVRLEVARSEPAGVASAPPRTTSESPPTETRSSPWPTVGLALAGAGVVGLGIGTVFGIEAKSKYDQSNSSGCSGDNCTPRATQIRNDALSAASASDVAFAIGGALAAGGIVLWLVSRPSDGNGAALAASPVALGGGGGIVVTGGWR